MWPFGDSHVTTIGVWGTPWFGSGGLNVEKSLLLRTGRSGRPVGEAVMDPANLRVRDYLAQLGWLNRPAIRGVAVQCTVGR